MVKMDRWLTFCMGMWLCATSMLALQAEDKPKKSAADVLDAASKVDLTLIKFDTDIIPLLEAHCYSCHGDKRKKGGISLTKYKTDHSVLEGRKLWERVAAMVRSGEMPPKDFGDQPTPEDRELLASWIEDAINRIDCSVQFDPGRVTIRRLNRFEYNNTIRDLVGVDFQPAADFPTDDIGYGFDNIGDVLSLPALLFEKYLAAAEKITEQAIAAKPLTGGFAGYNGSKLTGDGAANNEGESWMMTSNGTVSVKHTVTEPGNYIVRVRGYEHHAGNEFARVSLSLDDKELTQANVPGTSSKPSVVNHVVKLEPGDYKFGASFLNDFYKPDDPNPQNRDRNLVVLGLEIQGPILTTEQPPPTEIQKKLLFRQPKADLSDARDCATDILGRFTRRAFRRPVSREELDTYVALAESVWQEGESFELAMQIAMQSVLISPNFLFRMEQDQEPAPGQTVYALTEHELATRLSYFLWSSMPDDELTQLADQHALRNGTTLRDQVQRMLRDPKAQSFVESFTGQWLQTRSLKALAPDPKLFPEFDDELRDAMRRETELFFSALLTEDRSLLDIIDGKFTFVNERLAKHYGMPGVKGPEFQRVTLDGVQRAGVLTQATVLTVTSNPTRTSPVKRGKWVLDNILGTPPPPPPPNIPELESQGTLTGSLRERMVQHRENPSCASCHARMDPLGFGFENFDAIGGWRTKDGEFAVDPAGELPSGERFDTPQELRAILRQQQTQVARCVAEKMLTYAVGRGLEYYDKCAVDTIVNRMEQNQYRMSTLILSIVESEPFQKRRAKRGDQ